MLPRAKGEPQVILIESESEGEGEEEEEVEKEAEDVLEHGETFVLGIDPGPNNLGVCLYHVEKDAMIHLIEINLDDFVPTAQQKSISCFNTDAAVTSNIGLCVLNMIQRHKAIFRPDLALPKSNVRLYVAIEIQMNENPNNCCVLSSLQSYYTSEGIECYIFSTKELNKYFPTVFLGTVRNRPLRKRRIREYGYMMLRPGEKTASMQYQKRYIDPPIPPGSRKRGRQKPSEHALDAMFYGMVLCAKHPAIQRDVFKARKARDSNMRKALAQLARSMTPREESEEGENFMEALRKRKREAKAPKTSKSKNSYWTKKRRWKTNRGK
jgi:hypothetical protein